MYTLQIKIDTKYINFTCICVYIYTDLRKAMPRNLLSECIINMNILSRVTARAHRQQLTA